MNWATSPTRVRGRLANGRTNTIGLVFPPAGNHYTGMQLDFIGSVIEAAAAYDYDVLLSPERYGQRPLVPTAARRAAGRRRDPDGDPAARTTGSTISPHWTSPPSRSAAPHTREAIGGWAWTTQRWRRPVCTTSRTWATAGSPSSTGPSSSCGPGTSPRTGDWTGFTKAAAERGLTVRTYCCGDDAASGQACLERILHDDPATTALVTLNEAALGGLYRGLAQAGRHVPRDFSVTGVVASRWAETVTPQLTAADVPAEQMGRLAVDLLVERLDHPGAPARHHLLAPPISLRASTAPAGTSPAEPAPDLGAPTNL